MSPLRRCSRIACSAAAVATLTYVYADSTAVVGPLATYAEPHCYDLCQRHAARLTVPLHWDVVRQEIDPQVAARSTDDLEALANAVREAARPGPGSSAGAAGAGGPHRTPGPAADQDRRGHLRVLRTPTA